jgi:hypothetical protein
MTNFKSAPYLTTLALFLCFAVLLGSPQKVRAAADGQTPPAQEETPKPDPGTTAQGNCISEDDGFHRDGKRVTFVITLTNKCEARIKCEVFAYMVSAKGPSSGRATLILATKSKGDAARKSYAMKVKMASGSVQSARECKVM